MEGIDKSKKQLAKLSATILDMSEAQEEVLRAIYDESQKLVPVDEGDLKDSGNYDSNRVEYGTDHCVHVEFGTIKMKAQPYLRPAVMNQLERLAELSANKIEEREKEAV